MIREPKNTRAAGGFWEHAVLGEPFHCVGISWRLTPEHHGLSCINVLKEKVLPDVEFGRNDETRAQMAAPSTQPFRLPFALTMRKRPSRIS